MAALAFQIDWTLPPNLNSMAHRIIKDGTGAGRPSQKPPTLVERRLTSAAW